MEELLWRYVLSRAMLNSPEILRIIWRRSFSRSKSSLTVLLDTQVALNYKRGMNVVEITSNVNGVVMRGEDYAPDLRKAFDKALKNIERQVKKHKSYLTNKVRMKVQDISFDIDPRAYPGPGDG